VRVLHIDTGREMQGGQWQVLYLAERLAGSSIEARPGSPLYAEAVKRGLTPANESFDLIHAHDARAHTKCVLTAKVPFVVSRRVGFPVGKFFFSRLKYRYAERYLAVSNFVADQLRTAGVPDEKIRVVYDGIPIPAAPATPQPGRVIAVASKAQELPGIPVHLTRNLFDDLETASVFLYVSQMEGLGSAAIAAMASGVPVVASAVGGLPEVVEHERTGLLVRDGDYAGAVRRLLDNPSLAAEMGAAGREKAIRQFSVEKMVESTLSAYNEILR
jgi:glycosyltransferase involved in cell wall biosynthesis